jgi:circadian clock protein KaiC
METNNQGEKCPTGIVGFDILCEGGLVRDSINLVVGNAGAGKTTFLLQFLYNGVTNFNENGLYVSFEQDEEDLHRAGMKQGMDFKKLGDRCEFLRLNPNFSIKEIEKELIKRIAKNDLKRICFDPINVFYLEFPKEINLRKQLYEFLSLLKKLDVCVLIAGESDIESEGNHVNSQEVSFCKYVVDGVVELFSSGISGKGDRAVRILKMRMTNHKRGPVGMEISSSGIKVLKN